MADLLIPGERDTPEISFKDMTGELSIKGYSYPENVNSFYDKVIDWLQSYVKSPQEQTVFNANIIYFNTASSKILLDIFKILESLPTSSLTFNWTFEEDDFEMELAGEEFSSLLSYQVNLIKK